MAAQNNEQLERDIFGGSDSELSSDEGDFRPNRTSGQTSGAASGTAPASASSGGDSEDDYEEQHALTKPKKRRTRKADRGDGEGRVSRKRKRKSPPPEIDLNELPPEQANKIRLDRQIEAILKPKKSSRPKKKKNDEVLDSFADEEVIRLKDAMNQAADDDIRANSEKQPAMAKLRMLAEAMETLRKASLAQSFIDNNLLDAVKRWLEPLPDRSLPSFTIQREFFSIIKKMEFIDSAVLKESGLGRIVLFYTKCKRVDPKIKKTADDLVSTWSRPIIKRSASYRDRVVPTSELAEAAPQEHLNSILARAREQDQMRARKHAVAIPASSGGGEFTVAPRLNAGVMRGNASVDADVERRRRNAERMRVLTRKIQGAQKG